jgi:hypothetical protein
VPATSPSFDGTRIALVAARGEVVGLQVLHRGGGPVVLTLRPREAVPGGAGAAS